MFFLLGQFIDIVQPQLVQHVFQQPFLLGREVSLRFPAHHLEDLDRPLGHHQVPIDLAIDRGHHLPHLLDGGRLRKIDVGWVNDEPFLLMVSTGLDALAVHGVDQRAKRLLGQVAYAAAGLWSALTVHPRRIEVRVKEGRVRDRGYLAIVSNSRYYAGPHTIAEDIRIDDGLLNVILFKKSGILETMRLAVGVLTGRHRTMPDVAFYAGTDIRISGRRRMKMQVDGDKAPPGPAHIRVKRRFLSVFVPDDSRPRDGLEAVRTVLAHVFAPPAGRATPR